MSRGTPARVGDKRTAPNGYEYIKTTNGWVTMGRYIAGQKLGRHLRPNERIKYLDGDHSNNDPANIEVYVVKQSNPKRKLARLEAQRDEINAQIEELEIELGLKSTEKLA